MKPFKASKILVEKNIDLEIINISSLNYFDENGLKKKSKDLITFIFLMIITLLEVWAIYL